MLSSLLVPGTGLRSESSWISGSSLSIALEGGIGRLARRLLLLGVNSVG